MGHGKEVGGGVPTKNQSKTSCQTTRNLSFFRPRSEHPTTGLVVPAIKDPQSTWLTVCGVNLSSQPKPQQPVWMGHGKGVGGVPTKRIEKNYCEDTFFRLVDWALDDPRARRSSHQGSPFNQIDCMWGQFSIPNLNHINLIGGVMTRWSQRALRSSKNRKNSLLPFFRSIAGTHPSNDDSLDKSLWKNLKPTNMVLSYL